MKCPICEAASSILETRGAGMRRRRECFNGHRFTTVETVVQLRPGYTKARREEHRGEAKALAETETMLLRKLLVSAQERERLLQASSKRTESTAMPSQASELEHTGIARSNDGVADNFLRSSYK